MVERGTFNPEVKGSSPLSGGVYSFGIFFETPALFEMPEFI